MKTSLMHFSPKPSRYFNPPYSQPARMSARNSRQMAHLERFWPGVDAALGTKANADAAWGE